MKARLHNTWLAGGGALLLILALTGATLGADIAADGTTGSEDGIAPLVTETETAVAFIDADGDGIEDACDTAVVPDADAAAKAEAAADANGDGTISVSEAAQSDRIGGKNCNHGGYVSQVAQAQCDEATAPEDDATTPAADDTDEATEDEDADEPCTDEPEADAPTTEEAETPCVEVAAPAFDPAVFNGPGAFGAYVSTVAKSDAVGGKNCNHGGAVSEAVKAAKAAAKAERDAAKAERRAERDAAKAARNAAKQQGKGKSGN